LRCYKAKICWVQPLLHSELKWKRKYNKAEWFCKMKNYTFIIGRSQFEENKLFSAVTNHIYQLHQSFLNY
jgi:hypothetical protein